MRFGERRLELEDTGNEVVEVVVGKAAGRCREVTQDGGEFSGAEA
jgi:hypothetical protein